MNETMSQNSSLWTICLSHTLGRAIDGMKTKSQIFGIDKNKFTDIDTFVQEARKTRKVPKSAGRGNRNLNLKILPKIKTNYFCPKSEFENSANDQNKLFCPKFEFENSAKDQNKLFLSKIQKIRTSPKIKTNYFLDKKS